MRGLKGSSLRLILAASTGALALMGGHAFAADAAADAAPAAANSNTAPQLEELVVTAEKRAVNIQEVPASISAIKGDKLQDLGLSRLTDYAQYIPGLVIEDTGTPGQTTVVIRGISPLGPGSVVGYYIDDTPLGSSTNYARATEFGLDLMPYDLERLEVLRGPQGTLYGAGAMGGLLKYVLKQADTTQFGGQIGGEVNSTDHSSGVGVAERFSINIPLITDHLAIRGSLYNQEYRGYEDNVRLGTQDTNGGYQRGGRLAVTFKPTDNFKVNLNAMWYRTDFDDTSRVRLDGLTTHDENGVTITSGKPLLGDYSFSSAYAEPFLKNIAYYSGTINWDLGKVDVISATSYSRTHTHQFVDSTDTYGAYTELFGLPQGVSYFDLGLDLAKFTEEFRLQSPTGGRFEWLAGAYYTHETSANHQLVNVYDANYQTITGPASIYFNPFFAYAELPTTYTEYALFGDLTWNVTSKFDVTGGIRYAHNSQDFAQISDGFILGGYTNQPGSSSEGVVTWSANARYHFTDDIMAYARVATGYRPGGPNIKIFNVPPQVNSDTITNYEAGIKSTFWGGRAMFDLTAYDIEWNDIQLGVSNIACGCSYLSNGGKAYSRGFELEGSLAPMQGLRIGYNAAYTKASLSSLAPGAPPYFLGYQLPDVPKFTAGLTADYSFPISSGWSGSFGAGMHYVGSQFPSAPDIQGMNTSTPNTKDPAYTTFDLHAGVGTDRYQVNLFVRNVADKLVYLQQGVAVNPLTGASSYITAIPLEPRVIGVSVDAKF